LIILAINCLSWSPELICWLVLKRFWPIFYWSNWKTSKNISDWHYGNVCVCVCVWPGKPYIMGKKCQQRWHYLKSLTLCGLSLWGKQHHI